MPLDFARIAAVRTVNLVGDHLCVVKVLGADRVWFGSSDSKLYSLDLGDANAQPAGLEGHTSYISGIALAGPNVITGSWDRNLIWWDAERRQRVRTVEAHALWIRQIAVTRDQRVLASISDDMRVKLWDAESGRPIRELLGHHEKLPRYAYRNKLYSVAFTPDGRHVAANDELAEVVIWDVATGREAARFTAADFFRDGWENHNMPYGGLRCMAFSPDGRSLALGGQKNSSTFDVVGDSLVQVYDWQAGRRTHEFKIAQGHGQYESIGYHPRGDWLVAAVGGIALKEPAVRFFDVAGNRTIKELISPASFFGLAVDETGDAVVTVGRGKIVKWA